MKQTTKFRLGRVGKKILILLQAGIALGLTRRPDFYFKILKSASKEWNNINRKTLKLAIQSLYQSKLIDSKINEDGTVSMLLTENGKNRALRYSLDNLKFEKPKKWDGLWRVVIFDIPEKYRKDRDCFALKLKSLNFQSIQKSVFINPYDCKNELDFLIEVLNIRRWVRMMLVKDIDIALELENKFHL